MEYFQPLKALQLATAINEINLLALNNNKLWIQVEYKKKMATACISDDTDSQEQFQNTVNHLELFEYKTGFISQIGISNSR